MFKIAIFAFAICCVERGVQSRTMAERAQANYDSAECKKFLIPAGKVYEWFFRGPNGVTYDDARAECENLGGDLAVFSSVEDQNKIAKVFREHARLWNKRSWIGLTKNGEKLGLDSKLMFDAHSYWQHAGISGAGNLNDYGEIDFAGENNKLGFVCQFSSAPWSCDE